MEKRTRQGHGGLSAQVRWRSAWLGMVRSVMPVVLAAAALFAQPQARAQATPRAVPPKVSAGALQVYFIDVEGGQSTLFVTPAGHSLLVDTGWAGNDGRDAKRIVAAMQMAKIKKLDVVWITHYHLDHVGGVPELVKRVPVGMFVDHGPDRQADDDSTGNAPEAYREVLAQGHYAHKVLKPGDALPVPGLQGVVVSGDGVVLAKPLSGAGQANAFCADAGQKTPDATENVLSLGFELDWGKARVLDLGDLTRDKEKELMCPVNKLGHIDLLVVSHHGWYQSSSRALVDAITPRVAVMDNGATKGGSMPVLETLREDPSHPALWQLHASDEARAAAKAGGKPDLNTSAGQIANLMGADEQAGAQARSEQDAGYLLRATVLPSGAITVWNQRTGKQSEYQAGTAR